jgi:hypothetical protein
MDVPRSGDAALTDAAIISKSPKDGSRRIRGDVDARITSSEECHDQNVGREGIILSPHRLHSRAVGRGRRRRGACSWRWPQPRCRQQWRHRTAQRQQFWRSKHRWRLLAPPPPSSSSLRNRTRRPRKGAWDGIEPQPDYLPSAGETRTAADRRYRPGEAAKPRRNFHVLPASGGGCEGERSSQAHPWALSSLRSSLTKTAANSIRAADHAMAFALPGGSDAPHRAASFNSGTPMFFCSRDVGTPSTHNGHFVIHCPGILSWPWRRDELRLLSPGPLPRD